MKLPKEKPLSSNLPSKPDTQACPCVPNGHFFEIHIQGQISELWAEWFEGLTIEYLENGEMLLCGYVVDQSALMGILNKLVRLNLTLLSLNEIKK